jgi:capsid portal protein
MRTSKLTSTEEKVTVSNIVLDVVNPIPFEPTGKSSAFQYVPQANKKYVPFLPPDDNFFQLLFEAKLLSPTNNACVNSKTNFCVGDGLFFKDGKEDVEFIDWCKKVNKKGQSFYKILKSIFNNNFTVGNNFVEIIRVKAGSTKQIRVVNRSFLDCRLSEPNDDDICESVFISKKFNKNGTWTLVNDEAVELPIYYGDPKMEWYKSQNGTEHCVIHIKNDTPGYEYYGMPDNISSLPQQILEYKAARHNIDDFENNLVVGGAIFLEGNVTQDEANKIGKELIKAHTGDGKRGRWTVIAGQKGITSSKMESFDTQKDGSFLELDKLIESKIIDSNNWDSTLYGQHQAGGLGSNGFAYLSSIFDTKYKTVIEPAQKFVLNDFINPLFEIHDDWVGTKWSDFELEFKKITPASFAGSIDINGILTIDEGRATIGQLPLEDKTRGSEIIAQKNKKNVQNQPS